MLSLSFEQFQELLTQNGQTTEEVKPNEGLYHTTYPSQINTPVCKGSAINIAIREGITLIRTQLTFAQDTTIEMKSFLPQIGFGYCLSGKTEGFRQNSLPKSIAS